MATDKEIAAAKAFFLSEKAGDTVNYPWEAVADYAAERVESILDLIAKDRDRHRRAAGEHLDLVKYFSQLSDDESRISMSQHSTMANMKLFIAGVLSMLIEEIGKVTTITVVDQSEQHRSFRCKSVEGYSIHWRVGLSKSGRYKALSASKPKLRGHPVISDFLPFPILDAVYGHSDFATLDEAELFVRSL